MLNGKKVVLKVLFCMIATGGILLGNVILFQNTVERKLDLVSTYIASEDIAPRTEIREKHLIEVTVSRAYLPAHIYIRKEDIIGKYTDIQGKIPAGSVFYEGMLVRAQDMPDHPTALLKEGQVSYAVQTDIAQGGSIAEGERIDVHVSLERRDNSPLTGCLIENARVIGLRDHQGLSINNEDSSGVPYLAEIAVSAEDVDLLALAESVGEVRLFASSRAYDTQLEASRKNEDVITQYLVNMKNSMPAS